MVRYEDNSLLGALPADGPIIPQGRGFPALRMEIQEDEVDFYPEIVLSEEPSPAPLGWGILGIPWRSKATFSCCLTRSCNRIPEESPFQGRGTQGSSPWNSKNRSSGAVKQKPECPVIIGADKLIIRQHWLVNIAKIPSNCTLFLPSHSTFSSAWIHGNIYPHNSLSVSSHIPSPCAGKWTFNLRGRNSFHNNKERGAPLLGAGENIFAAAISLLSLLYFYLINMF